MTEALHEEGIKADKHADSLKPYQGYGRRPPDNRDADRTDSSKEVKSKTDEHYSQKSNL